MQAIGQKLDGHLPSNKVELDALTGQFMSKNPSGELSFDWTRFFVELCDSDSGDPKDWDKNGWYCLPCIQVLLKARLRIWWSAKKLDCQFVLSHCRSLVLTRYSTVDIPVKEDCVDGYDCPRQQDVTHAEILNVSRLCDDYLRLSYVLSSICADLSPKQRSR